MLQSIKKSFRAILQTLKQYRRGGRNPQLRIKQEDQNKKIFQKYGKLAKAQGFNQLYMLLSFDCDTPEDIPAAQQMDGWLREHEINSTYCVPGTQLIQGADVYRLIAENGAVFINHGALPHAEWRDGRYWPITFYNEMKPEDVIEDIRRGDEIFRQVLEQKPMGFRAPHFGCYQAPEQRKLIYDTIRQLGYRYSTSTLPEFALNCGPVLEVSECLYEIPLTGSYQTPLTILDSWNYIESPYHTVITDQYAKLFIQTVEQLCKLKIPGVLNYYVDPAHVYQSDAFYQVMLSLKKHNIRFLAFKELLDIVDSSSKCN